jgi:diguanylate cyclase (GGDEF)-like protein/PAS domain S-box-containing protein
LKSSADNTVTHKRAWYASFVPRSVVARTSFSILLLAVIMGMLFSAIASWRVRAAEQDRLVARVHELLATVENTVSIACFLNDATLAKEIASGLMKNRIVAGVTVMAGATILYGNAPGTFGPGRGGEHDNVSKPIYSPFAPDVEVGRIILQVSHAEIEAQATANARYTVWILSLQMSIVAAAVALLVYLLVTRPIKGISDELHMLEIRSGMRLKLPSGRRKDEIGQLVIDVNVLMARLTDALDAERDLRRAQEISERRLQLVVDKADTGILVLDEQGAVQSCNPAFVRILGPAAQPGARLSDLLAPHGPAVASLIVDSYSTGAPRDIDLELAANDARGAIWVELSVNPLGGTLMQALVNDITERKGAESAAQELASRDTLTGLLNRRGFDAALAQFLAPSRREIRAALLLIDLDRFKAVNDTYGHEAGDRVLREVARVFDRTVRRSDTVGRLGGDEFAVLLHGVDNSEKAQEIARTIIAGISQPVDIGAGLKSQIGASIGIAFAGSAPESPASLLRRADGAMYVAKQAGRGHACVAAPPASSNPPTECEVESESDAA